MDQTYTADQTALVAKELLTELVATDSATIVGLSGDLGAGKTTLVKAVAKLLGVEESVQSPTFVFMREYQTKNKKFKNLYHIDAYRFDTKEEGDILNLKQLKKKGNLIIIEWPEKIDSQNPNLHMHIKHKNETERDIEIKDHAK